MCCMAFLFSYESKEICCQYTGFSLTGNHKTKGATETELLPPPERMPYHALLHLTHPSFNNHEKKRKNYCVRKMFLEKK